MLLVLQSCASASTLTSTDVQALDAREQTVPVPENEELAKAWAAPEESQPATQAINPEVSDPGAAYKTAFTQAQHAFKGARLQEARSAAQTAVDEASRLDADARAQSGQLHFKIEQALGDVHAAQEAALAWRLSCGPEKVLGCRNAALSALAASAKSPGAEVSSSAVRELQDAESCAVKAEQSERAVPCEHVALMLARRKNDAFLEQKILLGQALREKGEARQLALLEQLDRVCQKPQCAQLRRKALSKRLATAREKHDVARTADLALREVAVIASTLPEAARPFVRTSTLIQSCAAYDLAHGAGSCRKLEKQILGWWTFRDFSKDTAGPRLSPEHVKTVNEHFAPLIQECLMEQALRMTPPDAQRFDVNWAVLNNGRVGEAHLPKDLDDSPLAQCLRSQFSTWRYPRYSGETQNIEQSFTVRAVQSR